MERLDRFLSHAGFGSRSDVKYLLHSGSVTLNGTIIKSQSTQIDLVHDEVAVDGEIVSFEQFIYLMMNKPQNYVCANKDGLHETVFSLLDEKYHTSYISQKLHIIGRLDIDTEGLLIFTTDGNLTHYITSPKSNCSKTYFVRLRKAVSKSEQDVYTKKCALGIHILAEGREKEADCKSAELVWKNTGDDKTDECELTIYEGKYHEVKRIFFALGNEVTYLKRISIAKLKLDTNLKLGEYRSLTCEEVNLLKRD